MPLSGFLPPLIDGDLGCGDGEFLATRFFGLKVCQCERPSGSMMNDLGAAPTKCYKARRIRKDCDAPPAKSSLMR